MGHLFNRNIIVGVSGGIAAYKSAELVRLPGGLRNFVAWAAGEREGHGIVERHPVAHAYVDGVCVVAGAERSPDGCVVLD